MNFWQELKKPIIVLAPMAGVTDIAFRQICKEHGADVIFTEFASTNALVHGNQATRDMIRYDAHEQPVVCQLHGTDPEMFMKSAAVLAELGFAGIDINFGCPAYKVVRHGGGVTLMRNLDLCHEIVDATIRGAGTVPVSIKVRASINKRGETGSNDYGDASQGKVTSLQLAERIQHLDIKEIMVHGRSYERPFDGAPDYAFIKEMKQFFKGIVIANGGVNTPEEAAHMLTETGADGVGLARGAQGRPWLFNQIKEYIATGRYTTPTIEEIKKIALRHAALAVEHGGPHGLVEMRKHLLWYMSGFPNSKELRTKLVAVKTLDDVTAILGD